MQTFYVGYPSAKKNNGVDSRYTGASYDILGEEDISTVSRASIVPLKLPIVLNIANRFVDVSYLPNSGCSAWTW